MECILINKINDSDVWSIQGKHASAELRYNFKTHSLRLLADDQHVYFMERQGLLRTRIAIKSEYGQHEGDVQFSSARQGGTLRVHDHKFSFHYQQGALVLKNENGQALASLSEQVISHIDLFELAGLLFASVVLNQPKSVMQKAAL